MSLASRHKMCLIRRAVPARGWGGVSASSPDRTLWRVRLRFGGRCILRGWSQTCPMNRPPQVAVQECCVGGRDPHWSSQVKGWQVKRCWKAVQPDPQGGAGVGWGGGRGASCGAEGAERGRPLAHVRKNFPAFRTSCEAMDDDRRSGGWDGGGTGRSQQEVDLDPWLIRISWGVGWGRKTQTPGALPQTH